LFFFELFQEIYSGSSFSLPFKCFSLLAILTKITKTSIDC